MKDPFKPARSPMEKLADIALPVLVDRAGGSVEISGEELVALGERLGGRVGVQAEQLTPTRFRLRLVRIDGPKPELGSID